MEDVPQGDRSLSLVKQFHQVFEYPNPSKPSIPGSSADARYEMRVAARQLGIVTRALKDFLRDSDDKPVCIQRLALMTEELTEFAQAMGDNDIEAAFDALLDSRFVGDGSVLSLGLEPVFDEGMRRLYLSNMSKLKDGVPVKDEQGKVVKGDWYQPIELGDLVR
jgi:predicted HAD superfamily Cof-like phosphohydrolase